ncbi:unnamed protein product [Cylindrotheca closterium]|uniref:RING-type domain-containing protein n=1 Tax=Cylindrotheca closterium TaxID=2856 RepID=A0AAD2CFT7_9STRA|nr:unnamed protein product [Cylindrotheca closterium]
MPLQIPNKAEGSMILLSMLSYAGLGVYNHKVLEGQPEQDALMTFMAWVWISSFVMMLGGAHKLKFCTVGTLILFSNMPMLSSIGLGWICAFESMMWLCFQAQSLVPQQKKEILSGNAKKQKRLEFIRKTVITRRIRNEGPLCGESCTICLHDFKRRDTVCFSPNSKCTHAFHLCCAQEWLSQHVRCPCCRENYLQKAGKKNVLPEADPTVPCLKDEVSSD